MDAETKVVNIICVFRMTQYAIEKTKVIGQGVLEKMAKNAKKNCKFFCKKQKVV